MCVNIPEDTSLGGGVSVTSVQGSVSRMCNQCWRWLPEGLFGQEGNADWGSPRDTARGEATGS